MTYLLCLGTPVKPGARSELGECNLWTTSVGVCAHRRPPRVCIDLGLAHSGLALQAATFDPHILVLTHADDDHIGGFEVFAERATPRELWIPYEWGLVHMAFAAAIVRPPKGMATMPPSSEGPVLTPDLVQQLEAESNAEKPTLPSVYVLDEEDSSPAHWRDAELGERDPLRYRPQNIEHPESRLRSVTEDVEAVIQRERAETQRKKRPSATGTPKAVAKEVVCKAGKLSRILSWAEENRVRIRYFSTDAVRDAQSPRPWRWVGRPGIATIVNALEVRISLARVEQAPEVLYRLVALTTTNRRALVTFLWGGRDVKDEIRGALVWSDSAGETCLVGAVTSEDLVPWPHVRVMTAPHHGSDNSAHDTVWKAWWGEGLRRTRQIPVVVSGGKPGARTVPKFTDLSPLERACTYCRHDGRNGQHKTIAALFIADEVWIQPNCVGP